MGPNLINGIPAHVLFVHAVVALVPLTALSLVLCAVWPSVMRRFGLALPLLALVTLGMVPVTTHAGEWLAGHVEGGPLVNKHAELGDQLLPWVGGLFVMTAAVWLAYRRVNAPVRGRARVRTGAAPTVNVGLRIVLSLLAIAVAGGAAFQTYRVGDSGAKAAWTNGYSAKGHGDGDE